MAFGGISTTGGGDSSDHGRVDEVSYAQKLRAERKARLARLGAATNAPQKDPTSGEIASLHEKIAKLNLDFKEMREALLSHEKVLNQIACDEMTPEMPSKKRIALAVAFHFGTSMADLMSRSRHYAVSEPRQVAMYLMREAGKKSFHEIGKYFLRDHTTVVHAHKRIEAAILWDENLRKSVETLAMEIKSL